MGQIGDLGTKVGKSLIILTKSGHMKHRSYVQWLTYLCLTKHK
jgi:hypothetical protein